MNKAGALFLNAELQFWALSFRALDCALFSAEALGALPPS